MYIVRCKNGQRWKIREAVSLNAALNCIAHAKVSGSVGSKDTLNQTYVGGGITVLADVVQINSDGTERKPYTVSYQNE